MSERVLETEKFAVARVPVRTHDGQSVTKHVVVHPGAVALVPVLDDGRLVLIRNERFAVGRPLLEVPAGTLAPGEPPLQCAARELREETGYRAQALRPLATFFTAPGFCDEAMHVFVATGLEHVGQALEPTEHIEPVLLTRHEVEAAIDERLIEDAKTLAALLLWLRES